MPASYHSSLVEGQWFFNNLLDAKLQKVASACDWESVDRSRARVKAEDAALRARLSQYVHSCADQTIGKWCWSDPDDSLSSEMGFDDTRDQAIQNAVEFARLGLAFNKKN